MLFKLWFKLLSILDLRTTKVCIGFHRYYEKLWAVLTEIVIKHYVNLKRCECYLFVVYLMMWTVSRNISNEFKSVILFLKILVESYVKYMYCNLKNIIDSRKFMLEKFFFLPHSQKLMHAKWKISRIYPFAKVSVRESF